MRRWRSVGIEGLASVSVGEKRWSENERAASVVSLGGLFLSGVGRVAIGPALGWGLWFASEVWAVGVTFEELHVGLLDARCDLIGKVWVEAVGGVYGNL